MRLIIFVFFATFLSSTNGQFKFDNVSYKTVYLEDLCDQLKANPKHLMLDVRSTGEHNDSSRSPSLNLGRLKGYANLNITMQDFKNRWTELLPYKNEPVFVYCSHSQRSRRASKMLADSGFINVININGGIAELNRLRGISGACLESIYSTNNSYKNLSPTEAALLMRREKELFVLDIRPDSVYRQMSTDERKNSHGKFKKSVNIPFRQLSATVEAIPKNGKVLIVDTDGGEAPIAAKFLKERGYNDVSILSGGMSEWILARQIDIPKHKSIWERSNQYDFLSNSDFENNIVKHKEMLILDIRSADEFANKSAIAQKNVGHIKGAINIPMDLLKEKATELSAYKNKDIVVYSVFGSPEVYNSALILANAGFKKVHVLPGGISELAWRTANSKGFSNVTDLIVDYPNNF